MSSNPEKPKKKPEYIQGLSVWKALLKEFHDATINIPNFNRDSFHTLYTRKFLVDNIDLIRELTQFLRVPEYVVLLQRFYDLPRCFADFRPPGGDSDSFLKEVISAVIDYSTFSQTPEYTELQAGEFGPIFRQLEVEVRQLELPQRIHYIQDLKKIATSPKLCQLYQEAYVTYLEYKRKNLNSENYLLWKYLFSARETLERFASSPNFETFQDTFSAKDQVRVFLTKFDDNRVSPEFWLHHPLMFRLVSQLATLFPNPKELTWGERLTIFQLLMATLGRHGVTDEEITEEIFQRWQPSLTKHMEKLHNFLNTPQVNWSVQAYYYFHYSNTVRDFPADQRKTAALKRMSYSDRVNWRSQIRNGDAVQRPEKFPSVNAPNMSAIRRDIRKRKGVSESLSAKELASDAEHITWLESKLHPLHHYLALNGFEIEGAVPLEMKNYSFVMDFYCLISHFAFRKGKGGTGAPIEMSPDPVTTNHTMEAIIDSIFDCGLLDLHAERNQSLHINTELNAREEMAKLIRFHFLCGRGCHPLPHNQTTFQETSQDSAKYHTLHIDGGKTSEEGLNVPTARSKYVEGKGLRVTTKNELKEIQRLNVLLGSAARAYEKEKERFPYRIKVKEFLPLFHKTQNALATTWLDFCQKLEKLTTQPNVDLPGYWGYSIDYDANVYVAKIVRAVFPTSADHDDTKALTKKVRGFPPVEFNGNWYPNLVAAGRAIGEKYSQTIRQIFLDHLTTLADDLRNLPKGYFREGEFSKKRTTFLKRYYSEEVVESLSYNERLSLMQKLRTELLDKPLELNLPI
jgi:hypothetical protein